MKIEDLTDYTLYTTLEPPPRIIAFALNHNVKNIIYGAHDYNLGFSHQSTFIRSSSSIISTPGILEEQSKSLLKSYFQHIKNRIPADAYSNLVLGRGYNINV